MPYVYLFEGITPRSTISKFIANELNANKISNIITTTSFFNKTNKKINTIDTIIVIVITKLIRGKMIQKLLNLEFEEHMKYKKGSHEG